MATNEKYFVTSNGDQPLALYFNFADACEHQPRYIDEFDAEGNHVQAYQRDWSDQYITDF